MATRRTKTKRSSSKKTAKSTSKKRSLFGGLKSSKPKKNVFSLAKKIRKSGENWQTAIKRAKKMM